MKAVRPATWLLLAALASCGGPPPPDPTMQLAERGIGGTGGAGSGVLRPLPAPTGNGTALPRLPADRGIGGTGLASAGTAATGIAGMITGFGSIFVNGLEVGLADSSRITMDGAAVPVDALRVGQVVVLNADPLRGARSTTQAVEIRHEVAGQVDGMDAQGVLDVAGQQVRLSAATLGNPAPHVGDWIAVSGFRNEAGEIAATRLDPAAYGQVIVHGSLRWDQGRLRIGGLPVETMPGTTPATGGSISVSGREVAGVLHAGTVAPDLLVADPAAFFGPAVRYFLIERYARSLDDGGIALDHGPHLSGSLWHVFPPPDGRSVIGFERGPDGALVATSLRHAAWIEPPHASGGGASGPGGRASAFMPAPVPRAGGPPSGLGSGFMDNGNRGQPGGFASPGPHTHGGGPAGLPPQGH